MAVGFGVLRSRVLAIRGQGFCSRAAQDSEFRAMGDGSGCSFTFRGGGLKKNPGRTWVERQGDFSVYFRGGAWGFAE